MQEGHRPDPAAIPTTTSYLIQSAIPWFEKAIAAKLCCYQFPHFNLGCSSRRGTWRGKAFVRAGIAAEPATSPPGAIEYLDATIGL